ncbi:MAG: hypothetical protein PHP74_02740 [Candidatus Gracilibacteria bacterium]|nr:hypothetical protein [Candidatus Gracilibacteria bacterium]
MQINITNKEGPISKILKKITLVFFGIFLTASIFAISSKLISGSWGIILGMAICTGLIFCGFYYIEKNTKLRLITWAMLLTIITIILLMIFVISFISKTLDFQ